MTPGHDNFSVALDLGTTTLSGWLIDETGEVVARAQRLNPQVETGADILSRLEYAQQGGGEKLQRLLVAGLNDVIGDLLENSRISAAAVASAAAAGNPGMICLFCNEPVDSLLNPPHKPPFKVLKSIFPDEVELDLSCRLQLLPAVSGFVGGDLIACLLAVDDIRPGTLLVDLGTNAEIALWSGDRWWVTSAAAGPAFEGGNISSGMMHAKGAITDVRLQDDRMSLVVAGDGHPEGICGSGLTALIAQALSGGLLDKAGTIAAAIDVETNLNRYLVENNGKRSIRYYHSALNELVLTQDDIRNFQLAKGAVRAGIQVLLEKCSYSPQDVPVVFLTGALGQNTSREVLKRVALLPEGMVDKTSFMESGVLSGLRAYLRTSESGEMLQSLVDRMQPFPLSGTPAFEKHYMKSLNF